jgi:hypothetical protein
MTAVAVGHPRTAGARCKLGCKTSRPKQIVIAV